MARDAHPKATAWQPRSRYFYHIRRTRGFFAVSKLPETEAAARKVEVNVELFHELEPKHARDLVLWIEAFLRTGNKQRTEKA